MSDDHSGDKPRGFQFDYRNYRGYMDPRADMSVLLDARGATKTELLFLETIKRDQYEPLYTLREREREGKDGNILPSAYQIYMNSIDEREAALKLVGSLRHWRRLCGLKWFMEGSDLLSFDGLKQWREDMRQRDNTLAKSKLLQAAESGSINAAKKLFDETKEKGKPGRPAKDRGAGKGASTEDKTIEKLHKQIRAVDKE